MKRVYNPGCALLLYKPKYSEKILSFLNSEIGEVDLHTVCCRHDPKLQANTQIINTCAGCDKRFGSLYEGISTISLWELLADSNNFAFPDYKGLTMTVHDACPVRFNPKVHDAIRALLKRMNIIIVEAGSNRSNSICCGDNFYPSLPLEKVKGKMKERADAMPCEDVCVYCISCIKSMYIGGKKPRYILDLLFNEPTDAQTYDTVEWHNELQKHIDAH